MMGEEKHLGLLGQFSENLKPGSGSVVIKVDEQIVRNEGQRAGTFQVIFYGSKSQCEIKRILGSCAHAGDRDNLSVRPKSSQVRLILIVVVNTEITE